MAKQEMKYEEAVGQLEAIVRRMETGELDLDSLAEELKKAQKLIKMCKDKLTKTDEEIKKMLEKEEEIAGVRPSPCPPFYRLYAPGGLPQPTKNNCCS